MFLPKKNVNYKPIDNITDGHYSGCNRYLVRAFECLKNTMLYPLAICNHLFELFIHPVYYFMRLL